MSKKGGKNLNLVQIQSVRKKLEKLIAERVRKIQIQKLTVSFSIGDRAALGTVVGPHVINQIAKEAVDALKLESVFEHLRKTE